MKKMKKLLVCLALLIGFASSVWAIDLGGEQPAYLVSLKAQNADASTGSGQVQLEWIDIQGECFTNAVMAWVNSDKTYSNLGLIQSDPYTPVNPTALGETAQLLGITMFASEAIEDANPNSLANIALRLVFNPSVNLYMTPYAYFKADAQGDPGSYFYEWRFTDSKITRQDTAMRAEAPNSTYFKVFPDSTNKAILNTETGDVTDYERARDGAINSTNNIYAVFKRYLLSNPQATTGTVLMSEGASTTLNVSIDVEGDITQFKASTMLNPYPDFVFPAPTFADDESGTWTWSIAREPYAINANKMRAEVVVTYTAKAAITEGVHKANITLSMAGGEGASSITIPLSVLARPASGNDANVSINGGEPTAYETLAAAVTAANNASGDVVLTLLRDVKVSSPVVLTNTMTLDLNGYTLSAADAVNPSNIYGMIGQPILVVNASEKEVTLAYNKFGGTINAEPKTTFFGNDYEANGIGVNVMAGSLVLNGGTISSVNKTAAYDLSGNDILTIAIKVDAGATLIQNGATITATSAGPKAFGIYNDGTVIINDGSISAEAGFNTAMAVRANDGSSTTINGGSLYAVAHEEEGTEDLNQNLTTEAIATWTNAYAVCVQPGSSVIVSGGDLFAEATNTGRAYTIASLAGFGGSIEVNKKAVVRAKSPNTMYSFPVAIMGGPVTINGGRFDGMCKSWLTGNDTICPPIFGVDYSHVTFKSGICKTETFIHEDDNFPTSKIHPAYDMYNVIYGGKDYKDGYRHIAVAADATQDDLIAAGVPACRIGETSYTTLEDALAYANNNPDKELVIVMQNDYTLPAGYYTIPKKATLVIPMDDAQSKETNKICPRVVSNDAQYVDYIVPSEYRRLTFASGVHMDVYGELEMTGTQYSTNQAYNSYPHGPYGRLVMEEGSHMTLQSGSEMRAWGYMTGAGETDARRGAKVREMFQLGDWKGAMTSVSITGMGNLGGGVSIGGEDRSSYKIFPVTQYFIQNVESPVKYHPGSVLTTTAAVSEGVSGINIAMAATDIKIVGVQNRDQAIFLMNDAADADNTWVRKWYDAENDVQVYDVNSAAAIGSMELNMGELSLLGYKVPVRLNSAKFDLPITNNMKIHLLTGTLDFEQNTNLLPGAEVEVDKGSTVSVAMSIEEKAAKDAGEDRVYYTGALYVFDAEDWDTYAYDQSGSTYVKVVNYSPTWDDNGAENGRPTVRYESMTDKTKLNDASINVHGTFNTDDGYVYTSAHGADIFSRNSDAGTFIFNTSAEDAGERTVYQIKGIGDSESQYKEITFISAQLKNGAGVTPAFAETGTAKEGDAYCYMDDKWTILKVSDDDACFMVDNYGTYYAKPAEYVAVNATWDDENDVMVGNADHTFSDAAGTGRLFILIDEGCHWWEVEKEDNLYHCTHPGNDTYYYWYEATNPANSEWREKTFTIRWKNWNGDPVYAEDGDDNLVDAYVVTYGTMAEFFGTNPERAASADYTYDFVGWTPALGPVTKDVTYTATFEPKQRKYTITFNNYGGTLIETQFLPLGASPVCENTPTKVGHYLVWSPSIAPVAGDATYTATWVEEPRTEFDITFLNYDGTTLKKAGGNDDAVYTVSAGSTTLVYDGAVPTKVDALSEYDFEFAGWKGLDGNIYTTSLPAADDDATYVAQFTPALKKYTVKFYKEGTTEATKDEEGNLLETKEYEYGETPTPPVVSKLDPQNGHTYTLVWKTLDETSNIQTVIGNASYKPTYLDVLNRYAVTLVSNPAGAATFTGAGIYKYNAAEDALTITVNYNSGSYRFTGWSDNQAGTNTTRQMAITSDITLTANFEQLEDLLVPENGVVTITPRTEYQNLILTSNGADASGQLRNIENLTLTGNAYFDLAINAQNHQWYAVAVPWQVDAETGVSVNGRTLEFGKDFDILYYDGAARAANGADKSAWKYIEDEYAEGARIMQPGKLYMIGLMGNAATIRFAKKVGADLLTTTLDVESYAAAETMDANWNGIANPALFHAYLNAGVTTGQVYDAVNGSYDPITLSSTKLVVGQPVFVQAPNAATVVARANTFSAAPARRAATAENRPVSYEVSLAAEGAAYANRISVRVDEDKEADEYVIGQDLVKMGVSSKVPQMWINRYNAKLCINTIAPVNEVAEYPLTLFAPKADEYTIHSTPYTSDSDYDLYLTQNGEAIWNLSDGAYTFSLPKGNTAEYGLRISAKAPEVATGIDEAVVDAQGETRKVLLDQKVFIIRGNNIYSIDGRLVK